MQEVFYFMKNDKELALNLLVKKQTNSSITLNDISEKTGYSKRQLIRLSKQLNNCEDMKVLLQHANTGREPTNKALESEIEFLRVFKESYPDITIAQFRDIFIEDVIYNPKMKDVVKQYHLQVRSLFWFRNLFIQEGWKSPERRKPVRRDGRAVHPLREPCPQRGMLVQIDGTPYDWFGNSEMWTLHLAVDDATSELLAGYFMPTERQLGYCWMMNILLEKHGIPMSLYSDKHSIFHSSKEDNLTQFGIMMEDLGIELVFANTPQAKGRIERANGTVQRRLPNDIKRFGIKNYDELNIWFNTFYIRYINSKFAFLPKDPHDAFVSLDGYDLSSIFTLKEERTIKNDSFILKGIYYCIVDENDEPIHIINDTKIQVLINVFTQEIFVLRYGKKYKAKIIRDRKREPETLINNQKELQDFLNKHR